MIDFSLERKKIRLVLFGAGLYFKNRAKYLFEKNEIVALVDNDREKIGTEFAGHIIAEPSSITKTEYDYVVVMSIHYQKIKEQLVTYGVSDSKIIQYNNFAAKYMRKRIHHNSTKDCASYQGYKVLLAYTQMSTGGAAEAVRNTIDVLLELRNNVDLAVDIISKQEVEIFNKKGVDVIETTDIYSDLETMDDEWLDKYDLVIVNSVDLILFATEICSIKKTILWIHDPPSRINTVKESYNFKPDWEDNLIVYAVSDLAKKSFINFFPTVKNVGILHYGIHGYSISTGKKERREKLHFAVIGAFSYIKGQDIMLDAIDLLPEDVQKKIEVWFVGTCDSQNPLLSRIKASNCASYKGYFEKDEMGALYESIDVVVSSSREDMLPTVLAEGMSHKKVCMTSDATGIATYIDDGISGLVFKSEDSCGLAKKIEWCIDHKDELKVIGERGRMIFEKYLSIKELKFNINNILKLMTLS
ncbi:glycosyltransferase family 4 protein [Butyrivibrio sp. LC3010]|uniref:glycosyltransferase family 4 protein n=1 Tax=Butyrivibrio sp. LC3010 TaxID=1280680 RepID=UPI00042A26A4|nr:glycosyltransferase family 4 protein [Butyrivibrio sp. LC3010]